MSVFEQHGPMFRRRLAEQIAFACPFSKLLTSQSAEHVAGALGVHVDVAVEAVELRRAGFRLPLSRRQRTRPGDGDHGYKYLLVHVAAANDKGLRLAAKRRGQSAMDLIRSLLHAAMQTSYEPTSQPPRIRRDQKSLLYARPPVSNALALVVGRRAALFGMSLNMYVNVWLADYLSGKMPPMRIPNINREQCFDDESLYAVPVFHGAEDGAPKT